MPSVHRVLRILSIMLITAGIVVLADAGLTLIWQEPLSAAYGSIKQGQAEDELNDLEAQYPTAADLAAVAGVKGDEAKARILADRYAPRLKEGHAFGRIQIDRINLDIVVVQGTDTASLEKGPGHYKATSIPGQPGTVAIAGHRTTYLAPFRHIDSLHGGNLIRLEMPYGTLDYRVQNTKVVEPTDFAILHRTPYQRLVLTACHPLYSASQRIVAFARLDRVSSTALGAGTPG
jgi:sortase A